MILKALIPKAVALLQGQNRAMAHQFCSLFLLSEPGTQPDNLSTPWAAYHAWVLIPFSWNSFYHIYHGFRPHAYTTIPLAPTDISFGDLKCLLNLTLQSSILGKKFGFLLFWHLTVGEKDFILTSGVGRKRDKKRAIFFFQLLKNQLKQKH